MVGTRLAAFVAFAFLAASGLAAQAQEKFPARPIQIIMPTPPGGGTDILGRQLAEIVEPIIGQKIVVENKPGGGGTVGIALATQARPDGYTLAMVWNGAVTTTPHTRHLPYTTDSYAPILQIGAGSYVVCVQPDFPANTAGEMFEHLKTAPGKYTYGNDGVGNTMQLAAERIFGKAGVKVRPVPFGGAGETLKAFLGGHVDFYGGSLPPVLPHVQAGRAKCLLLTSADDNPTMPAASGLTKLGMGELETVLWWGLIGPKGLPADRLAIIEDAFRKGTETERYRAALAKLGASPTIRGHAEFAKLIKTEHDALGEVVRGLGLQKTQ